MAVDEPMRPTANVELLENASATTSARDRRIRCSESLEIIASPVVLRVVDTTCEDSEILGTVVLPIVVDMVDDL